MAAAFHSSDETSGVPRAPSAAARARTVLAAATSAHARWLDTGHGQPGGLGLVTSVGLDRSDADAGPGRRPMVMEIADAAPLPVRDRIRARVRLYGDGTLDPDRPATVRLRPRGVELEVAGGRTRISPVELWSAEPDPMAACEGAFLSHLVTGHGGLVESLATLLDPDVVTGAERVCPLALDRHGLVLRVEYDAGHRDVRMAFPVEARTPHEVRHGVQALAAQAAQRRADAADRATGSRRAGSGRRLDRVAELFRAGPAAARLCSPEEE